jgi:HAMP domain-containing protein
VHEALRTLLLIALAGAALTGAAMAAAWWFEATRRLRRVLRRVLKSVPEAEAIAPGEGKAAGIDVQSGSVAVLWDQGASGLVYSLQELDGAELIVDGQVVSRVTREGKKPLEAVGREAEAVSLRLIFADPRFPEFELELWGAGSAARTRETPAEAVRRGRKWLAHVDAVLRRGRRAAPVASAAHTPEPEPRPAAPAAAAPVAPAAPPAPAPKPAQSEPPPWEDDDDLPLLRHAAGQGRDDDEA